MLNAKTRGQPLKQSVILPTFLCRSFSISNRDEIRSAAFVTAEKLIPNISPICPFVLPVYRFIGQIALFFPIVYNW